MLFCSRKYQKETPFGFSLRTSYSTLKTKKNQVNACKYAKIQIGKNDILGSLLFKIWYLPCEKKTKTRNMQANAQKNVTQKNDPFGSLLFKNVTHSTLNKHKNEVDASIKIQEKIDPFGGFLCGDIPLAIWADLGEASVDRRRELANADVVLDQNNLTFAFDIADVAQGAHIVACVM